jgi:histidinol-phosphatase
MSQSRPFSVADDLALALRLAKLADEITLDRYQALDLVIETKPDATPVTDADRAVEKAIREVLAKERPDDVVVGEEFGGKELVAQSDENVQGAENSHNAQHYWVIDPIDGTKNFLRGIPVWATLIGLSTPANEVIVGAVSAPALSRTWYAGKDLGAFVNESLGGESPEANAAQPRRLSVSKVSRIEDAQLLYSDLIGWGERKNSFLALQEKVWRTRGIGDFWSHMSVAEGTADLAVEPMLALWDMAALEIIVKEAGGSFTNLDGVPGSHGGSLVTSNGALHADFLKALKA